MSKKIYPSEPIEILKKNRFKKTSKKRSYDGIKITEFDPKVQNLFKCAWCGYSYNSGHANDCPRNTS